MENIENIPKPLTEEEFSQLAENEQSRLISELTIQNNILKKCVILNNTVKELKDIISHLEAELYDYKNVYFTYDRYNFERNTSVPKHVYLYSKNNLDQMKHLILYLMDAKEKEESNQ